MDFNLPGEDDPRRIKVREWFEKNPNPTYAQLAEQGWTASNWPEPWGVSADAETQFIIDEEIVRAGLELPYTINAIALNQCGQSLLTHGTEAQRQKWWEEQRREQKQQTAAGASAAVSRGPPPGYPGGDAAELSSLPNSGGPEAGAA